MKPLTYTRNIYLTNVHNPSIAYVARATLEEVRHLAQVAWVEIDGILDLPSDKKISQILKINPPKFPTSDNPELQTQLNGARKAWEKFILKNLTWQQCIDIMSWSLGTDVHHRYKIFLGLFEIQGFEVVDNG